MREKIALYIFIVVLFIVTYVFFTNRETRILREKKSIEKNYKKIYLMIDEYKFLSFESEKKKNFLNKGLLSFIQDSSADLNLSDRIAKIVPIKGRIDSVNVFYRKLSLNEIIDVINMTDRFSNTQIKSLSISKRYDEPRYADLNIEIEKTGIARRKKTGR